MFFVKQSPNCPNASNSCTMLFTGSKGPVDQ